MYSIYIKAPRENANSILIYDDLINEQEYSLIDPVLVKEDNSSGSLEFEVPICNIGYSDINCYTPDADVYVYKQGYSNTYGIEGTDDVYWSGRISNIVRDINNHKIVYCEGVLSFLNDTIQLPGVKKTNTSDNDASFTDPTKFSLHNYIGYLLDRHNVKVNQNRRIYLGETTAVYEPTTWYTNYESTMSILEDIASTTEGHLRVRRSVRNGISVWVLDLLNDDIWIEGDTDSHGITMTEQNKWRYMWVPNYDQEIEYGANMADLSQTFDMTSIVTVVYPLGKRKDNSSIEGIDEYYTISGADLSKIPASVRDYITVYPNENYIKSSYADTIGRLEIANNYDDVEDPTELMLLGINELTLPNAISYEVDAEAVDMSYRDRTLTPISVFDIISIAAPKHGLSGFMKVSKAEIPLDDPIKTKFVIGNNRDLSFTSLTTKNVKALTSELKYLNIKPYVDPSPPEPEPEPEEQE